MIVINKFGLLQKVSRLEDVFNQNSKLLIGRIICVYDDSNKYGEYPELYTVKWNNGEIKRGFLPHGLDSYNV